MGLGDEGVTEGEDQRRETVSSTVFSLRYCLSEKPALT